MSQKVKLKLNINKNYLGQQIFNFNLMQIGHRDLDIIDPDWKFAYFHAMSTKPGVCKEQNPELCECCLNIIHKEPVDLGVHAKQLEFMGFGFPLWYSFLKFCIILTMILIVSESCVSVYRAIDMNKDLCSAQYNTYISNSVTTSKTVHQESFLMRRDFEHNAEGKSEGSSTVHNATSKKSENINSVSTQPLSEHPKSGKSEEHPKAGEHGQGHGEGHGRHCTGIFILLSRIDTQVDGLQNVLRISTFLIIMLTLIFIRDTIYKTEQYYDERRCSLGDYSVIITKLPDVDGIQALVRRFFTEGLSEPYRVEEMILIPQLQELEHTQHEKGDQIKKLQKLISDKEQNKHQIQQIEKEIEQLQKKQNHAVQVFKSQLDSDKLHSESVIVVMSTQHDKENFLKQFEELDHDRLIDFFGVGGIHVNVDEAPEPRQIIWENINYPQSKRLGRIAMGWLLSILFIAVITGVFYFILKWKTHVVEQRESVQDATIIVFVALVLVIIFNKFVMGNVLHYFTHIQKHATSDNDQFSFAFKYALGMFFTTALMTLFVEALTYNNFYSHHYGVIEQESIMFFMNSFLVPFIWAINPFQIVVLIKRKFNFGKKNLTQREANHLMEDFNYDIGKRYAEILQTMWFTFLYTSLIPMGAFLTVIGIGLYYWVDKYNLLRRSSIHQNVSGKLSIIALKLLELVLVFMPFGQIIFDYFLRKSVSWASIVMLIVAIIYLCLPMNDIIDFFNKENFYLQEKPYKTVKHTFKDNYFTLHPLYSKTFEEGNINSINQSKNKIVGQLDNPVFSFAMGWLNNGRSNQTLSNKSILQQKSTFERDTVADDRNSVTRGFNPNVQKF